MSLNQYYESFRMSVFQGYLCRGENCSGWILSELDTWHRCPCGQGAKGHPEYPEQEEGEVEATPEASVVSVVKTQVEDPNDPNYIPF